MIYGNRSWTTDIEKLYAYIAIQEWEKYELKRYEREWFCYVWNIRYSVFLYTLPYECKWISTNYDTIWKKEEKYEATLTLSDNQHIIFFHDFANASSTSIILPFMKYSSSQTITRTALSPWQILGLIDLEEI